MSVGGGSTAARAGAGRSPSEQIRLYFQKWSYYERNSFPWRRLRMRWHFLRRDAYLRFPVEGNLLEALEEGRAEIGPWVLIEPGCWFALYPETAELSIGEGTIVNIGCMLAATERISVGKHCMFANNCFVADADHRFDDPDLPITWQGMRTKGPVTIGDNCWFGTNCVVTGGVTIGERTVIGANSVVTSDLPPRVIAAGAPARVIREIEFPGERSGSAR